MLRLLILSVFVTAVFCGCGPSSGNNEGEPGGNDTGNGGVCTISGSVKKNSADGAPISGVTVMLLGADISLTDHTGEEGRYSFSHIAEGSYSIVAEKNSVAFSPTRVNIQVSTADIAVPPLIGLGNGGTPGSDIYFPMKLGATWSYEKKSDSESSAPSVYTNTIVGTRSKDGLAFWMLETTHLDAVESYKDTSLIRVQDDTVYAVYPAVADRVFEKRPPVPDRVFRTAQPLIDSDGSTVVWLKFGCRPGSYWTIYHFKETAAGTVESMTARRLDDKTVTTASGIYFGCAGIETVTSFIYTDPGTGESTTSTETRTMWFAPGAGLVKLSYSISMTYSGETRTESFTTHLTAFSGF